MAHDTLQAFIADCRQRATRCEHAAVAVEAIAPVMHDFMRVADRFLKPEHFRADPGHYARNAVYIAPEQDLSLFALVWTPGQWTPVHDHGSWGVVGVLRGTLHERSYVRVDRDPAADENIDLRPAASSC
jgi:predicted metal-dependent enzyme (double-stranded beta helix superfamily)